MKISYVSTSDLGHGAGIAAVNTFNDIVMYSQKHNLGHDLIMWVAEKLSDNPRIVQLEPKKEKFGISMLRHLVELERVINLRGPQNYYSIRDKGAVNQIRNFNTDIVHLHSLHWPQRNFTPWIIRKFRDRPVIWTIHDMWPFTGHCCYSYDCERWSTGCGNCPDLTSFVPLVKDTTAWLMRVKERMYKTDNLTLVSPSVWLCDLAKSSYLFKDVDVRHIPYSLNQDLFYRARDEEEHRREFDGKTTILFACTWLQDPRKGMPFFIEALSRLREELGNITVLLAGIGDVPKKLTEIVEVRYFGDIKDRNTMNALYNKSDIFVCTTLADNLPNVVLESLSAGVPIVAFNTGGVPDMVSDGNNGYLVQQKDVDTLADRIRILLRDPELRSMMSDEGVRTIAEKFTRDKQAAAYLSLYEEKLRKYPRAKFLPSSSQTKPPEPEAVPRSAVETPCERKAYPCDKPFTQIYMVPRGVNDFRFCPYHPGNPVSFTEYSYKEFHRLFNEEPSIVRQRQAFLDGDFKAAGCKKGCLEYSKYITAGIKYYAEDYIRDAKCLANTVWLSMGPDCNIRCRYCLEKDASSIDFNSCDPRFMEMAGDFVGSGGNLLLTGGEPLLPKWGFRGMLQKLSNKEDCGKIWLQTNGVYLDDETCSLIMHAPVYDVGISFDTCREDLFNYLRRGSTFKQVFGNLLRLKAMKEYTKNEKLKIVILCAVLKLTADHLYDTVRFFIEMGFAVNLNSLHQSPFAPEFSNAQGIHNLTLLELESLYGTVLRLEADYGDSGLLNHLGFKGQVETILHSRSCGKDYQVNLTNVSEDEW